MHKNFAHFSSIDRTFSYPLNKEKRRKDKSSFFAVFTSIYGGLFHYFSNGKIKSKLKIMEYFSMCNNYEYIFMPQINYCNHIESQSVELMSPSNESISSNNSSTEFTSSESELGKICEIIPTEYFSQSFSEPDFGATKSHLIREGLRISIKSKLKSRGRVESLSFQTVTPVPESDLKRRKEELDERLTPEDEEKRKERREKNKVAARKCRKKKKVLWSQLLNQERTEEKLNLELKSESVHLQNELIHLQILLQRHKCQRRFINN